MYLLLKQQKLLLENFLIRNTPFLFLLSSIKNFFALVHSTDEWYLIFLSVVSIWYLLTLDPLYCLPCQLYKVLFIFYVNGFQINRKTFYHFMRYLKIFYGNAWIKDKKRHHIQFWEKIGFHTLSDFSLTFINLIFHMIQWLLENIWMWSTILWILGLNHKKVFIPITWNDLKKSFSPWNLKEKSNKIITWNLNNSS